MAREGPGIVRETVTLLAIAVLIVGALMGWHANRVHSAHGDLRTTRGRLPGFRRTRLRSGVFSVLLFVLAVFVIKDLVGH
jgi:hypothetical protein